MFSGREEDFYVLAKKVENYVPGVFPNVRGALAFAAVSQDVVTAATVAVGVAELEAEKSAEIVVQLFVVLSALTDGERFDVVDVSRRRPWLRELAQVAQKVGPVHSGTSTKSLKGDSVAATCAIERMENLVRRYCGRRDAHWKRAHSCGRHSHEVT